MGRFQLGLFATRRGHRARRLASAALVAVAATLTGAWATQLAAGPHDPEAMQRTITRQRIEAAVNIAGEPTNEHQFDAFSAGQMLDLAQFYAPEIHRAHERGQSARLTAARSRDAIKVSCIDDKLLQMQTVVQIVEPRFLTIRIVRHDDLRLRGQFSIIHQAWQRMRTLVAEVEGCLGDHVDFGALSRLANEVPLDDEDPSRAPEGINKAAHGDRPPEASTYQ